MQLGPAQDNDRVIMEVVSQCVDSVKDLRAVNRVSMHHGVIHVSDITSADGRKLNEEFLASAEFNGRRNDYLWPVKHHVTLANYSAAHNGIHLLYR